MTKQKYILAKPIRPSPLPRESSPKRYKCESKTTALHDGISQSTQKTQEATTLKFLKTLRAEGHRTILEEKQLSIKGLTDSYSEVWEELKLHKFYSFTTPRSPYVPSFVCEFYEAYGQVVPKRRSRLPIGSKALDVVKV